MDLSFVMARSFFHMLSVFAIIKDMHARRYRSWPGVHVHVTSCFWGTHAHGMFSTSDNFDKVYRGSVGHYSPSWTKLGALDVDSAHVVGWRSFCFLSRDRKTDRS